MKDRIIGLLILIGGVAFFINATSLGEIKYRQLKDSVLNSKECKVISSDTKSYISRAKDFDCKVSGWGYNKYDYSLNVEEKRIVQQCDEDFEKFDDSQKVVIEADTNCNTDTFFDYILTENGKIVSRNSVYTNEGKIKDFANLGRHANPHATYKVYFFHM